ncbi:MAG: hypothetical protein Q9206_003609 [Seirophora lacunosa]
MYTFSATRSLGAFLVLLVSALLLSSWRDGSTKHLVERDPSLVEISPSAFNASSAKNVIALPYGRHDFPVKLSNPHSHHAFHKRVDVGTLDYDDTVCKGRLLYQKILAAFEGTGTPGREFSAQDIDNGWVKDTDNAMMFDWEIPLMAVGKTLGAGVGEREPTEAEITLIDLLQRKPFKNANGEQVNDLERNAHHELAYIPFFNTIIIINVVSPTNQVKARFRKEKKEITQADILRRIPPLNRVSDVMWTVWSTTSKTPNSLRLIGIDGISNGDTFGIMKTIFEKGEAKEPIKFPGLKFGLDTEEGQALLATPNGLAIAWLMIDRAGKLGRRIPTVSIYSVYPETGGYYRMLWDLQPLSPTSAAPPGATPKPTSTSKLASQIKRSDRRSPHVLRKRDLDYQTAKCKGKVLYDNIQAAFQGKASLGSIYEFSTESLENGWRYEDEVEDLDTTWYPALKMIGLTLGIGDRVPTESETLVVGVSQSVPYKNAMGQSVQPNERSRGFYDVAYIPSFLTIIASDTQSPRNRLISDSGGRITEAEINRRVPPLNRLSDMIWTVWNLNSRSPNNLRYVGRSNVLGEDVEAIIGRIFDSRGGVRGWPGYTYGIDTEEGQALLATPNGIAVAWLLIDRAARLGRRRPKVTIWSSYPDTGRGLHMLWDLEPV